MKTTIKEKKQIAASLALALLSLTDIERTETISELESGIAIALAASAEKGKCHQRPAELARDLIRN